MTTILEYPRDWYDFATGSFFLSSINTSSSSPFTGRRSITGPNSQLWRVKVTLAPQEPELWMAMEGFIAELAGQAGLLRFADFAKLLPQRDMAVDPDSEPWSDGTFFDDGSGWASGLLAPSIFATAAASRGDTGFSVGGLPVSESRVLRRGDNIEIRRNGIWDETPSLHILIRDVGTDASGETRLEFRPALRKGIAAGDMVVLTYPMSVFRMIDDAQGQVERTPYLRGDLGFELIEAIV